MYKTTSLAERRTRLATVLLGALLYLIGASPAVLAQSSSMATRGLQGFTLNRLARANDVSSAAIPLGFSAKFYGVVPYTTAFVNNNGNLTFGGPLSAGTPTALSNISLPPILAPFLADADTRVPAGSTSLIAAATYGRDTVNNHPAFGVNWFNVGYANTVATYPYAHDDKLNRFQLVLIDRSDCAPGDFDIEFNYDKIQWEAGDGSCVATPTPTACPQGGVGGAAARIGYSDGTGPAGNFFELPNYSGVSGTTLDGNMPDATLFPLNANGQPSGLIYNSLNSGQSGRYRFMVRGGVVSTTADLTAPMVTITTPADGTTVNILSAVSGTVVDESCGSDVDKVTFTLQRDSDSAYWDGIQWTTTATPVLTTTYDAQKGTWSRSTSLPTGINVTEDKYIISATGYDLAGNASNPPTTSTVTVSLPQVSIVFPHDGATRSAFPTISGVATESTVGSSITGVKLQIQRVNDQAYWDGTQWVTVGSNQTPPALPTSYDATLHTFSVSGPFPTNIKLTDGQYLLTALVTDSAGAIGFSVPNTLTIDSSKPVVSIQATTPAGVTRTSTPILKNFALGFGGNATDFVRNAGTSPDFTGSGLARVDLYIQRSRDGKYWDGTSWAGTAVALPTNLKPVSFRAVCAEVGDVDSAFGFRWTAPTSTYSLPNGIDPGTGQPDDGAYIVSAFAVDLVGNRGNSMCGTPAVLNLTIDSKTPIAFTIITPTEGALVASLPLIKGTATDNSGGSNSQRVDLILQRKSDGKYWNGTAWVDSVLPTSPALMVANYRSGVVKEVNATTGNSNRVFIQNLTNPESIAYGPDLTGDSYPEFFVSNRTLNRVDFYDGATGKSLGIFTNGGIAPSGSNVPNPSPANPGTGGLTAPTGLVFGPDYNADGKSDLYVASASTDNVKVFDGVLGEFLADFTQPGDGGIVNGIEEITFGPDGNLYASVTDTRPVPYPFVPPGPSLDGKVVAFDGTTGAFLSDFVTENSGGLLSPTGLTFGPDATSDGQPDLYVCSFASDDIKLYDGVTGAYVKDFVSDNNNFYTGLDGPKRCIFGPDGNLYVSSFGGVQTFGQVGSGGTVVNRYAGTTGAVLPAPGKSRAVFAGGMSGPSGLAFNPLATGTYTVPPSGPPLPTLTTLVAITGEWSLSSSLPAGANLKSGQYELRATLFDKAGNSTSLTRNFTVDADGPSISITSPVDGTTFTTPPALAVSLSTTGLINVTAVTIRAGSANSTGPAFFTLYLAADGAFPATLKKTLTAANLTPRPTAGINTFTDAVNAILAGNAYIDVRTTAKPGGQIRGQFQPPTPSTPNRAQATLNGASVVPPVSTSANGVATAALAFPSVNGRTLDSIAGSVAKVQLFIRRNSDNAYWTGTGWVSTRTALPTTISSQTPTPLPNGAPWSAPTAGNFLPNGGLLTNGSYLIEARATTIVGLSRSAFATVNINLPATTSNSSPITVSSPSASQATRSITLPFTGPLNNGTAADPSRYVVKINGQTIAVQSANYNSASNTVTLFMPTGELLAGDQVQVFFNNLLDAQNRTLSGSTAVLIVQP